MKSGFDCVANIFACMPFSPCVLCCSQSDLIFFRPVKNRTKLMMWNVACVSFPALDAGCTFSRPWYGLHAFALSFDRFFAISCVFCDWSDLDTLGFTMKGQNKIEGPSEACATMTVL